MSAARRHSGARASRLPGPLRGRGARREEGNMSREDFREDKVPEGHLQELVNQVACDLGFKDPRFDVRYGTKPGDNYASLLYRVEISEGERKLSVILKSQLQNKTLRESFNFYVAFANEINFYKIILPFYTDMLQERGLLSENEFYPNSARCYLAQSGGGENQERDALVLQDLRPLGYVMTERTKGQDVAHCRVVLRALARLHAASFAAEHLRPEKFARLRDSITELFAKDSLGLKLFEPTTAAPRALDMIKNRFPEGTTQYKKAKSIFENMQDDLLRTIAPSSSGGNVITHGDCWTNNLLFKYSDSGEVETVCMVDYQVSRYASPVLDITYFLYTCTERAMRLEHMDALLQDYHNELQARMRVLGVQDPDALFSWNTFQEHLKRYSRYGLYLSTIVIPLFLAEADEVPDAASRLEVGCGVSEAFQVNVKDSTLLDRRFSDVMEDMLEKWFL